MTRTEWALGVLLAAAFGPAVLALSRVWSSVDYYSHGFLVPIVAGWVAYTTRRGRAGLPKNRDARGAGLLAGALALYFLSLLAGSVSGQGVALVTAAAGAIWLLRGAAWLRALAFPLGFLVFMVPLPSAWLAPLIVKLQLFVSHAAVSLLHAFDLAVARAGNVILLPGGESLFVAEACSGVTSVVTLTPLAVLIAYLLRVSPSGGALLVAAVIPIAMAANLLRVVVTVLAARPFGVEAVTAGVAHSGAGVAVYVLGCLLLVALGKALARGAAR